MKGFVIGVFAAALLAAPVAFADDHHDSNNHDNNMGHHDTMGGPMMGGPHDQHMMHHGWKHGDRLPQENWHAAEVDWHVHHLRRPPHGYHWVQVDGDFVLASIATGFILESAFSN